MDSLVDSFYAANTELLRFLEGQRALSLLTTTEEAFRKNLTLAAASYFEHRLTETLLRFCKAQTNGCKEVVSFVHSKAIKRQYHTFFDWDNRSANGFYGMFGEGFREQAKKDVKGDQNLDLGVRAFLEIGYMRNCIVHQNYAAYIPEKTASEVYELFKQALVFVNYLDKRFS
jgi:hypothetical protein